MLEKMQTYLYRSVQGLIGYGGRLLFLLLFLATVVYQAVIYLPYKEWVGVSFSSFWMALALLLCLLAFLILARILSVLSNRQLFLCLSAIYLIAGLVLIVLVPSHLRDDAESVWRAARSLNKGGLDFLLDGAYLNRYPHQLGLVSLERFVLWLSPKADIRLFFFLNLLAILGINYANWQISQDLFQDDAVSFYTLVALFAFLPQFFYLLFVYGLVYGLFLASFGLLYLCRFIRQKQLSQALSASLFLALSYWVRNNNSILLITVALVLVLEYLRTGQCRVLLPLVMTFFLAVTFNRATLSYYEGVAKADLEANPKITWLAMGLQDVQNGIRQPGWYNKYVRHVYNEHQGDKEAIEQAARENIKERLEVFSQNPSYTAGFFWTKFITTWTESTFQSIWSGPSKARTQPFGHPVLKSLYHGGIVYRIYYHYTHAYLILLYAGALGFLFAKSPSQRKPIEYYAYIYLAGGLVFHLLWETKSQYVYPYVLLLIPFAVKGWMDSLARFQKKSILS